jgi:hypothetical protein
MDATHRHRLTLACAFLALPALFGMAGRAMAAAPRIAFERVLPAPHDLGKARDIAIIDATGDTPDLELFIENFVDQTNHAGGPTIRDSRRTKGRADLYLAVKSFHCELLTREGEGSSRDSSGERVKVLQKWSDAICTARIDALSPEMKRLSTFYGRGQGTSQRVEDLTDDERATASHQAARYAAVDAAERITPRRVREIIPLDETAPAFDEGMAYIESGRLAEARARWEAVLPKNARSAALHFNLAALCEALGDRKAAQAHYTAASELAPQHERYKSEMKLFTRRQ